MHNLKSNFEKILNITKSFYKGSIDSNGNYYFYPNKPKMSDCEVIALSLVGETIGIDSENYLFGKIKSDHIHDIHFLKDIKHSGINNCVLVADKAYASKPIQTDLFNTRQIILKAPSKSHQHDKEHIPFIFITARKRIETIFSQLCDQLMLRRNYAKTTRGLSVRILCKITAVTLLQYINYQNDKPLNHLKYALAS